MIKNKFMLKSRSSVSVGDKSNCILGTGYKDEHTHISRGEDIYRTVRKPAAVLEAVLLGWL